MTKTLKKMLKRFTYGDYCTWPDDERWELIDGEAYDMTPAPGRLHQEISIELCRQFGNFLVGKPCKVYGAPFDVRLPKGDEADEQVDTVVQPDVLVVCDRTRLDDKGCRGAPDLVIEILSPSTASKDIIKKRGTYEKHKVKEFWLVHPVDRVVYVYTLRVRALKVDTLQKSEFGKPAIYASDEKIKVGVLPGLLIDLRMVFPSQVETLRESPRKYRIK